MIRRGLTVAVVAMMLASLLPAIAAASQSARDSHARHAPNRALVGVAPNGRSQAEAAIHARGGRIAAYYEPGDFFIVETPSAAPDWVAGMRGEPSVRYAELDYEITVDVEPNDSSYPQLWALPHISMPSVWDTQTGSQSVIVGVIDTGVDWSHEDLAARMWKNPGEFGKTAGFDDDGNGRVDDIYGNDCRNNDGNPMDDHGHGTHVAGTIGAAANNGIGVAGVDWNAKIMALKFLSASGSGSTTDAIECLDYAIAKGATLTNNSWGGGGFSQALHDAIGRAANANQLFVAAAGNSSVNTDSSPHYPSSYNQANIVSVAATDDKDALARFSNYGSTSVDLGAPGVSIISTTRNNTYESKSGTSMAAPHVAGAAALLSAAFPGSTFSALKERLMQSGDPASSLASRTVSGKRLNVFSALSWVAPPPSDDQPPSAISLTARGYKVKGVKTVDLTWTGTSGAVDVLRDNVWIGTGSGGGYKDTIGSKGGGTYTYKVCSSTGCSNEEKVVF